MTVADIVDVSCTDHSENRARIQEMLSACNEIC